MEMKRRRMRQFGGHIVSCHSINSERIIVLLLFSNNNCNVPRTKIGRLQTSLFGISIAHLLVSLVFATLTFTVTIRSATSEHFFGTSLRNHITERYSTICWNLPPTNSPKRLCWFSVYFYGSFWYWTVTVEAGPICRINKKAGSWLSRWIWFSINITHTVHIHAW